MVLTDDVYLKVADLACKIYTDQTDQFPVTSNRGNKYILVAYHYDCNTIHAEPLKTQKCSELCDKYRTIHRLLTERGPEPRMQILNNEFTDIIKQYIVEVNDKYQLVPPHIHRRNTAKRAISIFKNYFIVGLASVNRDFPLHLWCRMIPHTVLTLNILRKFWINQKLSTYAILHGKINYNATPLTPTGTKVIFHKKPDVRETCSCHGVRGWYIGPSIEHYRCHKVYISSTRLGVKMVCIYVIKKFVFFFSAISIFLDLKYRFYTFLASNPCLFNEITTDPLYLQCTRTVISYFLAAFILVS